MGYPRQSLRMFTPSGGGRIHRNRWQLSNGMGGSFAVESVAGLVRNTQFHYSKDGVKQALYATPDNKINFVLYKRIIYDLH